MSAISRDERTTPVGFPGLLRRTHEALDPLGRHPEVGIGVAEHHAPTRQRAELGVHDEVGIGHDRLVVGVEKAHHREEERPARSAGDDRGERLVVARPSDLLPEPAPDRAEERRAALRLRVAVVVSLDRGDRRALEHVGNREVGLADRQVHRVLEMRREVEHLADSACVDRTGLLREQPRDIERRVGFVGDRCGHRRLLARTGRGTPRRPIGVQVKRPRRSGGAEYAMGAGTGRGERPRAAVAPRGARPRRITSSCPSCRPSRRRPQPPSWASCRRRP